MVEIQDPYYTYEYVKYTRKPVDPEIEEIIAKNMQYAILYFFYIKKGAMPKEAEQKFLAKADETTKKNYLSIIYESIPKLSSNDEERAKTYFLTLLDYWNRNPSEGWAKRLIQCIAPYIDPTFVRETINKYNIDYSKLQLPFADNPDQVYKFLMQERNFPGTPAFDKLVSIIRQDLLK